MLPGSFYCLDNDIILKLATFDLFKYTFNTLEIEQKQIKILDSFKYKFSKQIKRKKSNKSRGQVEKYNIEKALKLTENLGQLYLENFNNRIKDIYNQLLNYNPDNDGQNDTIDQGEATLISYVSYLNQQGGSHYLLTGDKRCLRALNNSGLTNIIESLEGKVWCLEQLILKNIEEIGFENVKNKIVPFNNCDQALKVAFSHKLVTKENSKYALQNYLKELREETGKLLNIYGE